MRQMFKGQSYDFTHHSESSWFVFSSKHRTGESMYKTYFYTSLLISGFMNYAAEKVQVSILTNTLLLKRIELNVKSKSWIMHNW